MCSPRGQNQGMGTKPNLEPGRKKLEALMVDACTIVRDDSQEFDDVLNVDTLELVPPDHDDDYVYRGKCVVIPNNQYTGVVIGGVLEQVRSHDLMIPLAAPELAAGDVVTVVSCVRDGQLVNKQFAVTDTTQSTFAVARRVEMVRVPV